MILIFDVYILNVFIFYIQITLFLTIYTSVCFSLSSLVVGDKAGVCLRAMILGSGGGSWNSQAKQSKESRESACGGVLSSTNTTHPNIVRLALLHCIAAWDSTHFNVGCFWVLLSHRKGYSGHYALCVVCTHT